MSESDSKSDVKFGWEKGEGESWWEEYACRACKR